LKGALALMEVRMFLNRLFRGLVENFYRIRGCYVGFTSICRYSFGGEEASGCRSPFIMSRNSENIWRIWDPPSFPNPPLRNYNQHVLHLKQFLFVQKFTGKVEQNLLLYGKIEQNDYQKMIHSINLLINTPFLYYVFTKCILTFLNFVSSVSLILCLIFTEIIWAVISGILMLMTLLLIRFAGNLYFKAMEKLRLEIQSEFEKIQSEVLAGTNIKALIGEYCAWIEFFEALVQGERVVQEKTLKVFESGSIKPKGTITLPLIS
jgi:hypothetical protein